MCMITLYTPQIIDFKYFFVHSKTHNHIYTIVYTLIIIKNLFFNVCMIKTHMLKLCLTFTVYLSTLL